MLHLPHAMPVRLYARDAGSVILIAGTLAQFGIWPAACFVGWIPKVTVSRVMQYKAQAGQPTESLGPATKKYTFPVDRSWDSLEDSSA